jgi:hypothetical protein
MLDHRIFSDHAIIMFDLNLEACASPWLPECVGHLPPEALVLLLLDDGQNSTGSLLILLVPGGGQPIVQMLPMVIFPVFPELITFSDTYLQTVVYVLDGQGEGDRDVALPSGPLEVALITDLASVISHKQAVDLGLAYPQGCLRGEGNSS